MSVVARKAVGLELIIVFAVCCDGADRVIVPDEPLAPPPTYSAELPRVYVDTRFVEPTGQVIRVAAGGDLQAAIDRARPGDAIELEAGATFRGNFKLPAKGGSRYITVRSSAYPQLPAPGRRVTPAHAPLMPKILSVGAGPAITTLAGAGYYRLVGLEIGADVSVSVTYSLVSINHAAATVKDLPHHVILDRLYVHGAPTLSFQRCVTLNGVHSALIDSYLADCHGKGMDSQALLVWNTPGPLKITNNYLEGAGENVMFGGADPTVPGLVPSDIEFRSNYVYKPKSWRGVWTVKNSFETKNARRLLVEGNIFENNWADAQTGTAIVLKAANQDAKCPQCVLEDLTFRYNIVRNSPKGIVVIGRSETYNGGTWQQNRRIVIAHNLIENVGDASMNPGFYQYWIFQVFHAPRDLTIDHNTVFGGETAMPLVFSSGYGPGANFRFTNNIIARGTYGLVGDGSIPVTDGTEGMAVLRTYMSTYVFEGNVIVRDGASPAKYPYGNHWSETRSGIGFSGYALSPSSPFTGKAIDGRDPGADFAAIEKLTGGVQ